MGGIFFHVTVMSAHWMNSGAVKIAIIEGTSATCIKTNRKFAQSEDVVLSWWVIIEYLGQRRNNRDKKDEGKGKKRVATVRATADIKRNIKVAISVSELATQGVIMLEGAMQLNILLLYQVYNMRLYTTVI